MGFRKRFFQKLTLECVLCYRFYSTSYVLGLCHLNQKWPKCHRTEPQRFRAAVKMRNTKRLKFEINLKLRKCGDHWCAVCEARAARSDIYRSRFHPISAVLLTLILLRLWLCWLLTCSDCSQLFLKVLTLNLTEQRRGPSAVSGNKWWQGGPLYRSAACLFLPVFSCLSPPTLFTFYSGVSAVSIKISFT